MPNDALLDALSGCFGAIASLTIFYPLDQLRLQNQLDSQRSAAKHGSLYKGIHAQLPATGLSFFIYFYLYRFTRRQLEDVGMDVDVARDLFAAMAAGAANVLTTAPLWRAATVVRLAPDPAGALAAIALAHDGSGVTSKTPLFRAVVHLAQAGGLADLWKGTATSLVLVVVPVVQFVVYDLLKRRSAWWESTSVKFFVLGLAAKLLATFITYPLQVVQTIQRAQAHASRRAVDSSATASPTARGSRGEQPWRGAARSPSPELRARQGQAEARESGATAPGPAQGSVAESVAAAARREGMLAILSRLYRAGGFRALYPGLDYKLLSTMLNSGFLFFFYERALMALKAATAGER